MSPATELRDNSKQQLLKAAKVLFAKHGLDGTTVRDIADMAGTNVSMVSYHFGGKENLYRACIEEFGRARMDRAKGMLVPARSAEEFRVRLRIVVSTIVEAYLEEPELTKLLNREIEAGLPIAREIYESTFLILTRAMTDFFRSGQKLGIIRADIDPVFVMLMPHAAIGYFSRASAVYKKYFDRSLADPRHREKLIDTLVSVVTHGAIAAQEDTR